LAETARAVGAERVLALTATATPPVVEDICASFRIPREAAVVTGFHRPNLFLRTSPTPWRDRDAALLERVRSRPPGSGIVYVTLQRTAERVAQALADAGVPARPYHAGMDDETRTEVQEWWKGSDRGVVVATIAFGMGIDKADVRYVYHYNLPKGLESYSQEVGRAGRDGLPSTVEVLGSLEDVATLENFTFGDTPTRAALRGLLAEVLGGPREFDVSLYTLSSAHDIRPLVLRTALTYLELMGVLRQGTPFYAGYKVKPARTVEELAGRFPPDRTAFVTQVFAKAKKGREWYTLDPSVVAAELGEPRDRIVRMVDYFQQEGLAEVQVTDARQRFTRLVEDADPEALAAEMGERFVRREEMETVRVRQVAELVARDGCQTNFLLAHFGEVRDEPCGHCTWCETGKPTRFPPLPKRPPVEGAIDVAAFRSLVAENRSALGDPRQQARFLCGLSSPAVTRAKLSKHSLFGALEDRRFPEVLAWCEGG
ncbi:MAG TPA: helicase-related protein, partial [Longimicrobiaceae bacterium]